MGFGDPYHKHPLRWLTTPSSPSSNCFHCELRISDQKCFGCKDCDFYIHISCHDLPTNLRLPFHDQHLLTRFQPPPNSSSPNLLCNECQNSCDGRFAYHCTTCKFYFHLKCLFTLKLKKHQHPLFFDYGFFENCKICGSDIYGFAFACRGCFFFIHHKCSLIPLEIKHRHVHKLTLRHDFPEECDQVYCDLCEDRDGEMDRSLSYYYCKDCDYIAHVNCCITQQREDVLLCEKFTHEHPLRPNEFEQLFCTECSYTDFKDTSEFPSLVKHPLHPHHTLLFESKPSYNFNCTECHFSIDEKGFEKFTHPLRKEDLKFKCENSMFRCDACGKLGKGSRIRFDHKGEFDLHLECFALPGKLDHESHPNHHLYLRWLYKSMSQCCSICREEMDPQLWFYFCQECDYAAHMDCVARDLLSMLRSSIKNQPDFCAIIEPDESSFKYRIADMRPPPRRLPPFNYSVPLLDVGDSDLGTETDGYELSCPKCNLLIPTQAAYSTIRCWKSNFRENSIVFANDQTPSGSEPLTFLDERMIDELCCFICNLFIFPPTYSCASCQIFFHKSCAELPQKILFNETTYVLTAPPEDVSDCSHCKYPISSWAYHSSVGGFIFDVQCASGAPLVNPNYKKHSYYFSRVDQHMVSSHHFKCKACENKLERGAFVMRCEHCDLLLHPECGLLPSVIKHRIHWHPLELATDLAKLDCEYFCDVCEKDLNPDLWAYRCADSCGIWATSHVSCVITSKKKCHFSYDLECQKWTEEKKLKFRRKAKGEEVLDELPVKRKDLDCEEISKRFAIL